MKNFIYKEQPYRSIELFINKLNIQYLPERIVQQYAKLVKKDIPSSENGSCRPVAYLSC